MLADLALFFGVGSSGSDSSEDTSLPATCINPVERLISIGTDFWKSVGFDSGFCASFSLPTTCINPVKRSISIATDFWMSVGFDLEFCASLDGFERAAFFGEGDSF